MSMQGVFLGLSRLSRKETPTNQTNDRFLVQMATRQWPQMSETTESNPPAVLQYHLSRGAHDGFRSFGGINLQNHSALSTLSSTFSKQTILSF